MTPEGTPELAALAALRDEYPGIYYWEDPRWIGPLGEALRAAAHRPDVEYCHHCGGQCEFDFALAASPSETDR